MCFFLKVNDAFDFYACEFRHAALDHSSSFFQVVMGFNGCPIKVFI